MRSKAWIGTWTMLRAAMAAVIAAAIVTQVARSVSTAAELGKDVPTVIVNLFSFFTILSNAATAVVLGWAAVWYFVRGRRAAAESAPLAYALASVTTYMVITGIVYNLLLRGIELPQGSAPVPWSNEVLHVVAPIFLAIDLFVGPLRRALPWRGILAILVFPIVWVVYTLIRGPLTTNPISGDPFWYPYPFLNPNNFANGYAGVAVYVIGIAVAISAVAVLVVWVGRWRGAALGDPALSVSAVPVAD